MRGRPGSERSSSSSTDSPASGEKNDGHPQWLSNLVSRGEQLGAAGAAGVDAHGLGVGVLARCRAARCPPGAAPGTPRARAWPSTPPRCGRRRTNGRSASSSCPAQQRRGPQSSRRRRRDRSSKAVPDVDRCRASAPLVRLAAWRTRRCWRWRGPTARVRCASAAPTGSCGPTPASPRATSPRTSSRSATRSCTTSATGPITLQRFPDGIEGEEFYQKNPPKGMPDWVRTVSCRYPSGRRHAQIVVDEVATRGVGGADEHGDLPPLAGAHGRQRQPRRAAHRPRPAARPHLRGCGGGGPRAARAADGGGAHRLGQDERQPRRARLRPDRAHPRVPRRAPRRHRHRPRARAPPARPRHDRRGGRRSAASGSSSTSTRPAATAPSPRPTARDPCPARRCRCRSRGPSCRR